MVVVWIIVGIVVLGVAVWAFWPGRDRGVVDGEVRHARILERGRIEKYRIRP